MSLGELALGISIASTVPYLWEAIRGTVRPHRVSWFVWTVILVLTLLGYRAAGASDSAWFIFGDLLVTAATFMVSLWHGRGGYSRVDISCLLVALLSLAVWQLSKLPLTVMLGTMFADVIGVFLTLKTALLAPQTESPTPFAGSSLAALCGFLAVGQWNGLLLFYPAYLFLANFVITIVVLTSQYQVRAIQIINATKVA